MIYLIVRLTVLATLIFLFLIIYKRNLSKKTKIVKIVSIVMLIILFNVIWVVPFENLFLRFRTPAESFQYSFIDRKILKVMEHENNAVILYRDKEDSTSLIFISKDSRGWKIHSPNIIWDVNAKFFNRALIETIKLNNGSTTFVGIDETIFNNGDKSYVNTLSDSIGSKFESFQLDFIGGKDVYYYTFVNVNMNDPNYFLIINGDKATIH